MTKLKLTQPEYKQHLKDLKLSSVEIETTLNIVYKGKLHSKELKEFI